MEGGGLNIGDTAPPLELPGVDDRAYRLDDFGDDKVLGVMFICVHCPYVRAYESRFIDIQNEYRDQGLQLVAINPNDPSKYPEDSFHGMVKRAREKGYNFPYLRDKTQRVADAYGAQTTPDVFLFDQSLNLRFRGRPDNNHEDPSAVTRQYMREAIVAILEGRDPPETFVPPIGCSIKWVD